MPIRIFAKVILFPVILAALAGCGDASEPLPEMPAFNADRAWNYLGTQVTFGPRLAGHGPHDRQLAWMTDQLGFLADSLQVQHFRHSAGGERELQFANVIASWRPELRERVLLVTHWDTPLLASRDPDVPRRVYPVPGANDGASGTAVLMELAQLFKEQAPPIGVDLLFTDGTARGRDSSVVRLGIQHYLQLRGAAPRPRYAIFVDRVGDTQLRIPRPAGSAPHVVDLVWEIAGRMGRDTIWTAARGPAVEGDHVELSAAGIAAAAVVDPEYGPENRLWRTRADHLSNTSRESLAAVGEVLAAVVYSEQPAGQ